MFDLIDGLPNANCGYNLLKLRLQAKMANELAAGCSAPYDGAAGGYGGRARDEEDEPAPGPRQQERNKCRRSVSPQRLSGGNNEWGHRVGSSILMCLIS